MSRRKWYAVAAVAVVAALALGLAFGLGGGQEQSAPLAQGGLPSGGGVNEGIQVHGHWTIEVREPDGSLISRQEFENEFVGGDCIAPLLNGSYTVGDWLIKLSDEVDFTKPWRCNVSDMSEGWIIEPAIGNCTQCPVTDFQNFYTLNKSAGGASIYLNGSAYAYQAGNISRVTTYIEWCDLYWTPSQCNCNTTFTYSAAVTRQNLPQVIPLVAGQQVLVFANISFQ